MADTHVKSEIQAFYADQTIFITGGTGFLGKILIEKLLRSCDVKKLHILIRPKKGKNEEERFEELFNAVCFEQLKEQRPNYRTKVNLIYGDCLKPKLGLSCDDRQLLTQEINLIFHVAATVRFDQNLKSASYINVRALRDLLEMSKKMPHLQGFLHVSTVFSHCPRTHIAEQFYPPPMEPEQLLSLVDCMDEDKLRAIEKEVLQDWPNTYVYTKAVAEALIEREGEAFPVTMFRPGIAVVTAKEPVPGYADNMYGTIGAVALISLGIVRALPANPNTLSESVPVDYAVNGMIVVLWNRVKNNSFPIYNYVLSPWHKLTQKTVLNFCLAKLVNYPSINTVGYRSFEFTPNPIAHELAIFFYHNVPAYVTDFLLLCLGRERFAVERYRKVNRFLEAISYFGKRNWAFNADNVNALVQAMNEKDREIFDFNLNKPAMELMDTIHASILATRRYLLNESPDTLVAARKKYFWLTVYHYLVRCVFIILFLKVIQLIFSIL